MEELARNGNDYVTLEGHGSHLGGYVREDDVRFFFKDFDVDKVRFFVLVFVVLFLYFFSFILATLDHHGPFPFTLCPFI